MKSWGNPRKRVIVPSILITGVTTGLGRALVLKARSAGWRVFGTTRDERAAAEQGFPAEVTIYRLELRFPHAVATFNERFLAEHGAPDVLVNNAAFALYGPVEEVSQDALADLFQVNTFAAIGLINGMLPAMRQRTSGTIVNVTSLGGRMVFPFFTTYNASKHALEAFSEGLWHELKPFGIRVKAVEPGYIATPIYKAMEESAAPAGPYAPGLVAMNEFSAGIKKRSTPEEAAEEVWSAILDPSDRLRYPVAAYARPMLALRAALGNQRFIRVMHGRWLSPRR